jgi:cytoskeleton protein RodZ
MTVGTELKQARENAGLSPEQISERTKIQLYKIDSLENGTFELLPQGIYLDGIVRAYAQQVGIDPEPMVERVRLERGKLPGDSEIPFSAPIDLHGASAPRTVQAIDVPEGDDALSSFVAESNVAAVPIARPATHAPRTRNVILVSDLPLSPHVPYVTHAPVRPARGRARLALPVFALLAAVFWGAYWYTSSRPVMLDVTAVSLPRPASPTDQPVPFSESAISSDADRKPSNATANASARQAAPARNTAAPQARSASNAAPSSAAAGRPVETPARPAAPVGPQSVGTAGSIQNVSGSWNLATQIESSSHSPYAGLKLGYEMKLEQDGDRVTGVGRKVTENGSEIGPRAQTPLTVSGTIAGDRLTLTFVEQGTQRDTQGKFVLLVDEAGTLRGRFSSDAAQSSGRVEAHRVSTQ